MLMNDEMMMNSDFHGRQLILMRLYREFLVNVPWLGDLFHITFKYLLEMKYPQYFVIFN
jgi:hypothetical protein